MGFGSSTLRWKNYQMWSKRMRVFLHRKGQILWHVTVDTCYVQPMNFLAPGSRDMLLHSLDLTVWGGKFETIVESE
jgi:hypothetical protein